MCLNFFVDLIKRGLNTWRLTCIFCLLVLRGHSNNLRFPIIFPRMKFFSFLTTYFKPNLLWTTKWIRKKVSFGAYSCCQTKLFILKCQKNSVSKSKKSLCDTLSTPLLLECHILFEWPLKPPVHIFGFCIFVSTAKCTKANIVTEFTILD